MIALAVVIAAGGSPGSPGDTTADIVVGQNDFVHNGINNLNASGLNFYDATLFGTPAGVAVDAAGHLYVADSGNNRVLGYRKASSFTNGASADLVLGQPDFRSDGCNAFEVSGLGPDSLCGPTGVAVDSNKNLYVADFTNNRVLEYDSPFASCASFPCLGAPATHVFGQGGKFTTNGCSFGSITGDSLCGPEGVALDSTNRLYIADAVNCRVLEFDSPLSSQTATTVFGQSGSFTTNVCSDGMFGDPKPSATGLAFPSGVAVDGSGHLYIVDGNTRVLEFDSPLSTQTATRVFGQGGDFSASLCSDGLGGNPAPSATGLCFPLAVAVDGSARLYIADTFNNRVLEFDQPLLNQTATKVLGQAGSFKANVCRDGSHGDPAPSATGLCGPVGIALDSTNRLYIMDGFNNRGLEFDTPASSQTANRVLGQDDFTHNGVNNLDARGLSNTVPNPAFGLTSTSLIAVDSAGHLYVPDFSNNRVLGYRNAISLADGQPADLVLGQHNFRSGGCNDGVEVNPPPLPSGLGPDSLCGPAGVATDSKDNLYVADSNNSRVLEYDAPFASCASFPCVGASARRVFGQGGSFSTNQCSNGVGGNPAPSATSLCFPEGVSVNAAGRLYIADTSDNRVLEFDNPLSSRTATRVFGQNQSFITMGCNDGAAGGDINGLGADSLCGPFGVAVDGSGHLYIADGQNSRVLEFDAPLSIQIANRVFGQGVSSFTSNVCSDGKGSHPGPSAAGLCFPEGVAVDGAGRLYIADTSNNRVLEFDAPLSSQTANRVFGQNGHLFANACSDGNGTNQPPSADGLCKPIGVAVDKAMNLYVADTSNNRLLIYKPPTTPTATASRTRSRTPTRTPTRTATRTPFRTRTRTPSRTPSRSPTRTPTRTHTRTSIRTPTHTPARTRKPTPSPTRKRIAP